MGTNRLTIISILIGLLALTLSIFALFRAAAIERNMTSPECHNELNTCYDQCATDHSIEMDSLSIREHFAYERHLQQLMNCNYISNTVQRETCMATENEAYNDIVNSFRVLNRTITDRHRNCRLLCAEKGRECKSRS